MNRETTDKITVYARNTESESRKDTQCAFRKLRPLYVTHVLYLKNIPERKYRCVAE